MTDTAKQWLLLFSGGKYVAQKREFETLELGYPFLLKKSNRVVKTWLEFGNSITFLSHNL